MAAPEKQLFHQREFMHHAYLAKQHAIKSSSGTDTGYEVKDISPELERFIVLIKKGTPPAKVLEADAKYVSVKKMLVLDPDNDKKIKLYNEDDTDTDMTTFTQAKMY